ncbi:hypothetical protein BC826DRAFT_1111000, partial [Russula brevipes]
MAATIDQIDKEISDSRVSLARLPPFHPLRAVCLFRMALARFFRYELSDDERDLDMSILHYTHAIFLPLPLSTIGGHRPLANSIVAFYFLTMALHCRSLKFRRPTGRDVNNCVEYFRYLQDRSLEPFQVLYNGVSISLVCTLHHQMELDSGYAMQNVEEMSVLSRKLLASDVPELLIPLNVAIERLAEGVTYTVQLWNRPSEQVFECLREAHTRLPDLHAVSFALSFSLSRRFFVTKSSDDYEEAMTALDKIITSGPGEYLIEALDTSSTLANVRSCIFGNPEYLEEAIFRFRAYLGALPQALEDPRRRIATHYLTSLEKRRSMEFGVTKGPREAHSGDPEDVSILSLALSVTRLNATESFSKTLLPKYIRLTDARDTMDRITKMADVEEAVKCYRLFLASLQPSPNPNDTLTIMAMITWGDLLVRAFKHTRKLDYLNESIAVHRGALKSPHFPFPD